MRICPFILREVVKREIRVDEEGKVLEEKEIPSVEEMECRSTDCELYDEVAERCVLPLLSQVIAPKLEKGLDAITEGQKDHRNIISELSNQLVELKGSLEGVGELAQESLKALSAEVEKSRLSTEEGLSGMRESLSRITEALSQISETGSKEVQLLGDVSDRVLKEIPLSVESSGQKVVEGLSQTSGRLGELLDQNREGNDKIVGSIGELSKVVSRVSGLFEGEDELLKDVDRKLSEAVNAIQSFVGLEKERSDKIDEVVKGIQSSISKIGEFLSEEKERRETEVEREKINRAKRHNDRGVSLYYRGVFPAAVREFEKAIELSPDEAGSYNNLALCLTKLDRSEEATANFKKAIELNPEFAEAYNNLGLLCYEKTDYDEAVDLFNQALEKYENYALAYTNLGNALHQQKRYEEAAKSWERALEIDPGCEEAKRAIQLFKEGRVDEGHLEED